MVINLPSPHRRIYRAELQIKRHQTHIVQKHHSPPHQTPLKTTEHQILSILKLPSLLQEGEPTARQHQIHITWINCSPNQSLKGLQLHRAQASIHSLRRAAQTNHLSQTHHAHLNQLHTEDLTGLQLHTTHRVHKHHLNETQRSERQMRTLIKT